jgi:YHS domain-containing protein
MEKKMKMPQVIKLSFIVSAILFLVSLNNYAQDNKDNSCCKKSDTKMEKMDHIKMDSPLMDSTDHSQMDHSKMGALGENKSAVNEEAVQLTAREVDSSLVAWNEVCPVKGNKIDPEANKVEYKGKIYGFCCNGCDSKFLKNPEKYSINLSEDGKTFIGTK